MAPKRPGVLITTTHKVSENSRSFGHVLQRVIPDSKYVNRGSKNLDELLQICQTNNLNGLVLLHSRGNRISRMTFYELNRNQLILDQISVKFYQYIDPKIFGWKRLPGPGPLSISRESRLLFRELVDFFEKYLHLEYSKNTNVWLMLDKMAGRTYIQFVDALTLKKFVFAQIKLVMEEE